MKKPVLAHGGNFPTNPVRRKADKALHPASNQTRPLPLYQDHLDVIQEILIQQGGLGLLFIDASTFYDITNRYGRQVHHALMEKFIQLLLEIRGKELRKNDLITALDPGGDQFLVFLAPKRADRAFSPGSLEGCTDRLARILSAQVAEFISPYLKTHPQIPVGYAFGIHNPSVKGEQLIKKVIEEAKQMAQYRTFRLVTRTREKLQELILKGVIRTVFQPILRLPEKSIIGYEALSRGPEGSEFERADLLFEAATEVGLSAEMDRLCRYKAITHAAGIPKSSKLFVNCLPTFVYQREFETEQLADLMANFGFTPQNIVLEISEREVIENYGLFCKAIRTLTERGFHLAVDDVGSGYSSLELVAQLRPTYFKLDLALIRDIHRQPIKQALVRSLITLADQLDSRIIAEGIQTLEELQALLDLGVSLGQGYLFAHPAIDFYPGPALFTQNALHSSESNHPFN